MDSFETGMNPVTMTIISPQKKYWPRWGSNQQLPVLNSCTVPNELCSLAKKTLSLKREIVYELNVILLFIKLDLIACYHG